MFARVFAVLGLSILLVPAAQAVPEPLDDGKEDRVLSPYFHVLGEGDDVQHVLPLKATRADVDIAGVIAHVQVTQVYHNTGKTPIEAIYVFPGSTRAAVFGMKMTIGERTIEAQINKKEQARKLYEEAKSQGKSASLLEQQRPNVFQMNVANIMPGDEIEVVLDYSELMIPEEGFYEFAYPAVVGPRYSEKTAADSPPSESWVANPYLKKGVKAPYEWDIEVDLSAGLGIQKIASPSHQITPKFTGTSKAHVELGGTDSFIEHDADNPGNRDFVLRYRLSGGAIETGLLLFPGEEESFFLLMMQPPARVSKAQIPAREYVFIVDVSGSMSGFPLDTSKGLMKDLLNDLRPEDKFNVLMFAGGSQLMSEKSLSATRANIKKGTDFVDGARGGGSTQLLAALDRALKLPTSDDVSRTFVVVTDGYVNVENETFKKIDDNLGEANLFAFGIGSSVNRHIIEGMARVGMGEPFIVLNNRESAEKARKFKDYIQSPVLTNIDVDFTNGFSAYDVEPRNIPDLFAERPMLVFGKYRGTASGNIEVKGVSGEGDFRETVKVGAFEEDPTNEALRYLWARHKVRNLADMNPRMSEDDIETVTQLGLKYNLMTAYTSFVAIDSEVRNENGDLVSVKQPLPMPAGVENSAVGRGGYGGPVARRTKKKDYSLQPAPVAAPESEADEELSIAGGKSERVKEPRTKRVVVTQVKIENGPGSRADIERAIERVLKKLKTCGPTGTMTVRVTFSKAGSIASVQVISAGGASTSCVTEALKKAQLSGATSSTTTAVVTLSQK